MVWIAHEANASVCTHQTHLHTPTPNMESTLNSTRVTNFVINSLDRDTSRFPSPSYYEITLDEAVHDVVSMQLVAADVPFVAYTISLLNNALSIVLPNGSVLGCVIPTGDYVGDTLASAVTTAFLPSSIAFTLNASYSSLTDNITVTGSTPFQLVFSKIGSCALQLGFMVGSVNASVPSASSTINTVTAPFRMNHHYNPAIILSILPASVNTSVNQTVNQSFAILTPMRSALSAASDVLAKKFFHPPIPRFSRITLTFTNYDGSPVDFQNHDHRLELMFISLRSAKYQPFE